MGRKVGTGQTGQMQDWKNECATVYVILNIKHQILKIQCKIQIFLKDYNILLYRIKVVN